MVDFGMMLSMMMTLLLLIAIGYASRKLGFVDDRFSKWLSNFTICVGQPFMIINAVISTEYSPENLRDAGFIMILGVAVHAISAAVAFVTTIKYKSVDEQAIVRYGIIFGNCGFMGFPVIKALLGDIGLFWAAFYVIDFNIIVWTLGMFVLSRARKEIKMSVKNMLLNYGTTPCLIGLALWLVCGLTGFSLPSPVTSAIKYMSDICTPLSMIIVGALLATIQPKKLVTDVKVYYSCFVRLMVNPLAIILIGRLVGIDRFMGDLGDVFLIFAAVMASVPTAANSAMFAERYDLDPARAAHIVGMSTVLSAVTIPIMIWVAGAI